MDDQLDVPLEDAELLAEVELTTNLIIAASESESALPQQEIDRLLGVGGTGGAGGVAVEQRVFPTQQIRNA